MDDATLIANALGIAELASEQCLPASGWPDFAVVGGLMGYGVNYVDLFRRVATFVDKIFKGTKPSERTIPVLFGSASDPVEASLADSLARPGGNITDFMSIVAATNVKFLELIKELDPRVVQVLVLISSQDPSNL